MTGVLTGGGGGAYYGGGGRRRRRQRRRLQGTVVLQRRPAPRDANGIIGLGVGGGGGATGASTTTTYGGGGGTGSGGGVATLSPSGRLQLAPNRVYSAAAGAVARTVRTQAPPGARVVAPPAAREAAAAAMPPAALAAAVAAAAGVNGTSPPGTVSAAASPSGVEAAAWRDAYAAAAYFDPTVGAWGVDLACRFDARWNVANRVTLLATVVKVGVVTYGSAAGEEPAKALGLAYPQVAVRGGAMLLTFTYGSAAALPGALPGVVQPGAPAYPGVGFAVVAPATRVVAVRVAHQPEPSYGPILQAGPRFGGGAAIDVHPLSGRVWSANLAVWAPYWGVDGDAVVSNAGARITVFA